MMIESHLSNSALIKPVEEERVWLDNETANLTQVDLNAYFLTNGTPNEAAVFDQMQLAGQLYVNASTEWVENDDRTGALDKRA